MSNHLNETLICLEGEFSCY